MIRFSIYHIFITFLSCILCVFDTGFAILYFYHILFICINKDFGCFASGKEFNSILTFEHIRILYKTMENAQVTIDSLRELNSKLAADISELRKKFVEVEAENIEIKVENTKLKQAIEENTELKTMFEELEKKK
ncbi:hypothetical protein Glove_709g69 [Diversispora epigaea]|uniref:Uncharacterized protein n=1 Tax=Diversispora epigaea TaxID=1348612 RepID=A0A397G4L1_9GLOM|nr:hypothetical protein Glove_709g69 [Diversispora epigaea]